MHLAAGLAYVVLALLMPGCAGSGPVRPRVVYQDLNFCPRESVTRTVSIGTYNLEGLADPWKTRAYSAGIEVCRCLDLSGSKSTDEPLNGLCRWGPPSGILRVGTAPQDFSPGTGPLLSEKQIYQSALKSNFLLVKG
jgi:hypothetical protein